MNACVYYVCMFFERDVTQMNTRVSSTHTYSENVKLVAWLCIRRGTEGSAYRVLVGERPF
jgi:hypothetical protein